MKISKLKINIWTILAIISICFLLTITYWNSFNMPWERDEGEYAYSAWLLDQGLAPYENSFLQKPPMIIYTYWLAQQINPDALWPPRLLSFIATALTIVLLALIARRQYGNRASLITAWLAIPMLSLPHITALSANTEKFMLLFLTIVLALYVYYQKSEKKWPWILAGIAAAIALLYKPIALLPLIFIFTIWLIQYYQDKKNLKLLLQKILFIGLAGMITVFLALSYFIFTGTFKYFWEFVIIFNSYYAAQMNQYLSWAPPRHLTLFWTNWWVLFIITGFAALMRIKNWWFYLILILLSILSVFTSPIGHYYLLLMPWWILIATGGIVRLLNYQKIKQLNYEWQRIIKVIVVGTIMVIILWPVQQQYFLKPKDLNLWIYGGGEPFLESQVVADKVAELTNPDDKIFVAASEPQIYYYSKRLSVNRFIITFALLIDTPLRDKHQQQAIDALESDKPKVIVYSQLPANGLWEEDVPTNFIDHLHSLINNDYELIGGFVRDRDIYGHWQEPLTNEAQIKNSSLLLFKLKE
ncbi:MAG: hypothetical protein AUJ28_00845 [Parcubacteria group bacterium CG1_02_37_51]|uniref:Glycosyltransferase RgtA/B/C/D-like domain-containing protein n=2 Tax=Candidatus Komeiliibacteriota TaxID=1817908 RepID=A0A2M8DR34_9BACT|nr:MAG: hypothetical protein AUJ28_00845 [Parcubacteria group bacterium CG1_02_37_51]PIY95208.1 MAG: hypothetical protein COY67_01115 [Candidatus Komeilibacteria bacterium CG_4_10_14_0_8_um_filter_37_78]PJC01850.1 MAG: hypothetical protein CO073_02580 [Candidatus Komeilibacteria bacterium CG_4_9_14_0_8_um_filter_36_9]